MKKKMISGNVLKSKSPKEFEKKTKLVNTEAVGTVTIIAVIVNLKIVRVFIVIEMDIYSMFASYLSRIIKRFLQK